MQRALAALAVLVLGLAVAGCGEKTEAVTQEQQARMIEIMIEGGSAKPSGDSVEVSVGQPVELVVKADTAGEIHVHSDPEHEYEYEPGTTTFTMTVDRPGVVDVELHEPDQLIVQLEVR